MHTVLLPFCPFFCKPMSPCSSSWSISLPLLALSLTPYRRNASVPSMVDSELPLPPPLPSLCPSSRSTTSTTASSLLPSIPRSRSLEPMLSGATTAPARAAVAQHARGQAAAPYPSVGGASRGCAVFAWCHIARPCWSPRLIAPPPPCSRPPRLPRVWPSHHRLRLAELPPPTHAGVASAAPAHRPHPRRWPAT